jgi:hypothetical protein
MSNHSRKYLAFLLRLWQVEQGGRAVWRASLEDTRSGERRGFANLDALVEFLRWQTQRGGEEKKDTQISEGGKDE